MYNNFFGVTLCVLCYNYCQFLVRNSTMLYFLQEQAAKDAAAAAAKNAYEANFQNCSEDLKAAKDLADAAAAAVAKSRKVSVFICAPIDFFLIFLI